jgi:hypothetical protein
MSTQWQFQGSATWATGAVDRPSCGSPVSHPMSARANHPPPPAASTPKTNPSHRG